MGARRGGGGAWPSAELVSTEGLGHQRILRDERIVATAVGFLRADQARAVDAAPEAVGQAPAGAGYAIASERISGCSFMNPISAGR